MIEVIEEHSQFYCGICGVDIINDYYSDDEEYQVMCVACYQKLKHRRIR
jgi:predicted RNA-binding Zn-ribbon protein involved in translation (DUF1610 family)